jgi:hypothetical protein
MSSLDNSTSSDDENTSGVLVDRNDAVGSETVADKASSDDKKPEANEPEANESEAKEPQPPLGSVAVSKDLYAKIDKDGNQSWVTTIPDDIDEAAENEETKKFAVIVRKKKPKVADSTKPLVIDSIIIQSPHLKDLLATVLDGYPGIVVDVDRLTLSAPFECLIHRWSELSAAGKVLSVVGGPAKEHFDLLYGILVDELGELIQLRGDYFRNKAVAFKHAWLLFPPGCTVYGSQHGKPAAMRFTQGWYGNTNCGKVFFLSCDILEFDGVRMGWVGTSLRIPEFLGTMPFASLPCYPLEYHPQAAAVTETLLKRGRRFRRLAGFRYKMYRGMGSYYVRDNARREHVTSRIVLDCGNWEKHNSDHQIHFNEVLHEATYEGINDCHDISEAEAAEKFPLTDEEMLRASPLVRGYSLKNKRWMEFFIDDVSDIQFDAAAFDSLVLPQDHKDLVLAFTQSQVRHKNAFDDVISGKGKGIIMLLSGGPGIGKTLTAESVAEHMQVPLYSMSSGDLGAQASEVEEGLANVLQMVAHWNAVLLLDECDVFLQERGLQDMERNRMVSIFLRTLEYYEGILFLTTNRATSIDPAFESRIHISLEYPPLDAEARVAIWRGFLGRADDVVAGKSHAVTPDEVTQLSELNLNGRQIKNILKTANLLACHRSDVLSMEHLRTVLKVKGHSL